MRNKRISLLVLLGYGVSGLMPHVTVAQENGTLGLNVLFSTPQERQLINSNRYKMEEDKTAKPVVASPVASNQISEIVKEQVQVNFTVGGISINNDGSRSAWVNGNKYNQGEKMSDGTVVAVNSGANNSVSLVTPDGMSHRVLPGETINITYFRTER